MIFTQILGFFLGFTLFNKKILDFFGIFLMDEFHVLFPKSNNKIVWSISKIAFYFNEKFKQSGHTKLGTTSLKT